MSNRDVQPIKFVCRGCGSPIELTYGGDTASKIVGAKQVARHGLFDDKTDFVDLHLDFPVVFGKYIPGYTPYFQALAMVGGENADFHKRRLDLINSQYKKYPQVTRLIGMFLKGHYGPFKEFARKRFRINTKSSNIEDLNLTLYTIIGHYVFPFTAPDTSKDTADYYKNIVMSLLDENRKPLQDFLQEVGDRGFLANCQTDCLRIYEPIFKAELPLRPALFLDLDPTYKEGQVAMRVSTNDFEEYREVYKNLAELLSRLLVLVAGINNLIKRGNHNEFLKGVHITKSGKDLAPRSLNDFADVVLAQKPQFLDDCWFIINPDANDNKLRNAIAHNKIFYDETTQIITYYPKMEGMDREKVEEIQLLDYMRRLLSLFREVHKLHHLVKCLNYAIIFNVGEQFKN